MEQPYAPPVRPGYNLALASLIVGIVVLLLSCIPFVGVLLGVIPIVLGVMAMSAMSRADVEDSGKTIAIVGIVLGAIAVLLGLGWVSVAFVARKMMPHMDRMPSLPPHMPD